MPVVDLGVSPRRPSPSVLEALPRRVTLTLPELRLAAELAGGAPLPFDLPAADPSDQRPGQRLDRRLDRRLGDPTAGDVGRTAYDAALAGLPDAEAALSRRGLLRDGELHPGLLGAIGLLAAPRVALDLEVCIGAVRAVGWHRQSGAAVATLATSDGVVFELAWCSVARWGEELARVAVLPDDLAVRRSTVPDGLDLPYGLMDAAAEAVRTGRGHLLPVLATEHAGDCFDAHGAPLDDHTLLEALAGLTTECRGRLRALVADVGDSGEALGTVGVVSWVLLADGWRSLRSRRVAGLGRVTVGWVTPPDLGQQLAGALR